MKTSCSNRLHVTTLILLAGWLVFGSSPNALANSIVNGDFATGDLTGWTASAIDAFGNPMSALIEVVDLGGVNAAVFSTGEFATGPFISTLEQTFALNAAEPILSFDFSLPVVTTDSTGTGASSFSDTFIVSVQNGGSRELLLVIQDLALPDPFGTAPGQVGLGPSPISSFDFTLKADLSSLLENPLRSSPSLASPATSETKLILELFGEDNLQMSQILAGRVATEQHLCDPCSSEIPEAIPTLPILLLVLIPLVAANNWVVRNHLN